MSSLFENILTETYVQQKIQVIKEGKNMTWEQIAVALYDILEDIDTLDDVCKENKKAFRNLVMQIQAKKGQFMCSPDGFGIQRVNEVKRFSFVQGPEYSKGLVFYEGLIDGKHAGEYSVRVDKKGTVEIVEADQLVADKRITEKVPSIQQKIADFTKSYGNEFAGAAFILSDGTIANCGQYEHEDVCAENSTTLEQVLKSGAIRSRFYDCGDCGRSLYLEGFPGIDHTMEQKHVLSQMIRKYSPNIYVNIGDTTTAVDGFGVKNPINAVWQLLTGKESTLAAQFHESKIEESSSSYWEIWARDGLQRAGLFDKDGDYEEMLGEAIMELVKSFSRQGHSGMSAATTSQIFGRLASWKSPTPLTDDPSEWTQLGEELVGHGDMQYQSKRDPSCFSSDGGKTYWSNDDDCFKEVDEKGITWHVSSPERFAKRTIHKSVPSQVVAAR